MKHVRSPRDNRANQLNPQHSAYHRSRGWSPPSAQRAAQEACQVGLPPRPLAQEGPPATGGGSRDHRPEQGPVILVRFGGRSAAPEGHGLRPSECALIAYSREEGTR
jgi:hypothetical protein